MNMVFLYRLIYRAFTSLSTDINLPAMSTMQQELGGHAELTVTGFVIDSIDCAVSSTMELVILCRVFQAIGACTGPMISRAMIGDYYESTQAAQMLSTLMMIMAVAPIIGPLLGDIIINIGSWRITVQ